MIFSWIGHKVVIKLKGYSGFLLILIAVISLIAWDVSLTFGQDKISISGITEAVRDVALSLSVAGTISTIFLKEGSYVKKGQCILELEKRLEELEIARRKLIWKSKAELESAHARVVTLKSQLESNRKLFESTKSVSREELEKIELDYKLAVAEKKRIETEEERQRIEYEMALENLRKRRLKSPINGIINKLFLDVGESCEPGQSLVHVVDTSRCRLICNVEESVGRTLRKGRTVDLKIRTGSKTILKKGIMAFVSPVVDPASGLLEAKAEFDNKDGEVRPGVQGFLLIKSP